MQTHTNTQAFAETERYLARRVSLQPSLHTRIFSQRGQTVYINVIFQRPLQSAYFLLRQDYAKQGDAVTEI